ASDLALSSGCGSGATSCTLAITTAPGVSGSAMITITVKDAYGQSMNGPATLQVDPGASSSGDNGSTSVASTGGGGAIRWWELAWIALLAGHRLLLRRRHYAGRRVLRTLAP